MGGQDTERGEPVSGVTRDDLARVHARIDGFEKDMTLLREKMFDLVTAAHQNIANLNVTLTLLNERIVTIGKRVEVMPDAASLDRVGEQVEELDERLDELPGPPERPCEFFADHLRAHKEIRALWLKPLVSSLISAVVGAAVSAAAVLWALRDKLTP
jgi:hypothetical protein